jgi:flagellar hook protein FlgE
MSYPISLSGLDNAQTELNVIGNNIANAETVGFKESTTQFANLVAVSAYSNPRDTVGIGSTVAQVEQDFSQGTMETTGSSLDLAVSGQGFFTVVSPDTGQTLYTRNGNFTLDSTQVASTGDNYIIDATGNRLQILPTNSSGTITSTTPTDAKIPATDSSGGTFSGITVASSGEVTASYSDGSLQVIGTVALATFMSPQGLQQQGSEDYSATGLSGVATYGQPAVGLNGKLLSGTLEESNVDLAAQMVDLITAQQYYQANSKAIDATTTTIESIMNLHE